MTDTSIIACPAILMATRTLGIPDTRIGHILSVSQPAVAQWRNGARPIPRIKHAALCLYVQRALNVLRDLAPAYPEARQRIDVTIKVTLLWLNLAMEELGDLPEDKWKELENALEPGGKAAAKRVKEPAA